MNLPIGKLFYFVPKIQGYSGGTWNGVAGQSGNHYPPVGAPGFPNGNPNAGYVAADSTNSNYNPFYEKDLYDLFYEGNEPGLNPQVCLTTQKVNGQVTLQLH